MKPKIRWRPTKINDESVRKLEEAFKRDATIAEACAYAGISRETFYANLRKNKYFSDKIDACKLFPHIFAKQTLFKCMQSRNEAIALKAALEFLRRRNDDYKDKSESTNINTNTNLDWLSDDDLAILNDMRDKLNDWE